MLAGVRSVRSVSTRANAINCALFYGIAPWRLYERRCHYAGMSYAAHLWLNLKLAARWATWREDNEDRRFEIETNGAPC